MIKHTPTGFESDIDWLKSQIKALRLLASFPHVGYQQVNTIGMRILYLEKCKRNAEKAKSAAIPNKATPVVQLDSTGKFISFYSSIKEAAEAVNYSRYNLRIAIIKNGAVRGYRFMLKSDYLKQKHN